LLDGAGLLYAARLAPESPTSFNELTQTSRPELTRGRPCVVLVLTGDAPALRACVESVLSNTPEQVALVLVAPGGAASLADLLGSRAHESRKLWLASAAAPDTNDGDALTAAVERTLAKLAPADIALLSKPCVVSDGWLERLSAAAHADSNTASASALADAGTLLALLDDGAAKPVDQLGKQVTEHSMQLRPRLSLVAGPCVYLRRDALELAGALDTRLELRWALEVDFAQRCLLSGLAHVAADDVVVGVLAVQGSEGELPAVLRARYPYMSQPPTLAASGVLPRALEASRRPRRRLWVTIDARALTTTVTGTQRHILELVRALAATGRLRLRLVVSADTSEQNIELLRSLAHTEVLAVEQIDESTPRSTIFHRPQQVFGPPDLRLALRLGERIVLNQLDLIAYRNPGYHRDATAWHSHRRASRQALAAADRIVVFSEHTRTELLSDELVDDDRVRVVPPGLDHPPARVGTPPAALGAYAKTLAEDSTAAEDAEGFLFCLGTDFRHKNRIFAMRLLAELRERHGWRGRLVLAGTHVPDGSSLELERDYLQARPQLHPHVLDLGAVDEQQKLWLMSNSAAVVYPSVYEGFGLVPFEAALSGVPCLFAAQSSLAEVLPGESAAIVPWSASESAEQVLHLLHDGEQRTRHVERLASAARELTWGAAAAAMLDIYEQAAVAPVREAAAISRGEVEREQELRELIAAQDAHVAQLVGEREHARKMYDALNAEVGSGLSLIGPRGALPAEVQHGLLALSAHPALSRPLFGLGAGLFRAARAAGRRVRALARRAA
jgi:glycosyltransferase involved in cell wall biosynthesis